MTGWVILVRYKNGDVNISQDGYKTYQSAVAEVIRKDVKQIDDYNFIDEDKEIHYELKAVYINLK